MLLSIASAKVPATAFGAVPVVLIAFVVLSTRVWRSPAWAGATLLAATTPLWMELAPALARLRDFVPSVFAQTRARPGLAEGVVLAILGAFLVVGIHRLFRRSVWVTRGAGALGIAAIVWSLGPATFVAHEKTRTTFTRERAALSYTHELGRALDKALPARSVLFLDTDLHNPYTFEDLNLMFWSGRMTYQRPPDVAVARARGYAPFLVSPAAEPYAPVEGVPSHAWLRAYDLSLPARAPAPPTDARPLGVVLDSMEVLSFASGTATRERDRYAFFVRPKREPGRLQIAFHTRAGVERVDVEPAASLRHAARLRRSPWFIMPALGPPRASLVAIELGGQRVELAP